MVVNASKSDPMTWQNQLHDDPLPWLLEQDDPGVRYLALRDLLDRPADDPELLAARRLAHAEGPIATVLDAMEPEGYWAEPGAGLPAQVPLHGLVGDPAGAAWRTNRAG
jgi:hypothetical protein